jgi:hypothetical protein
LVRMGHVVRRSCRYIVGICFVVRNLSKYAHSPATINYVMSDTHYEQQMKSHANPYSTTIETSTSHCVFDGCDATRDALACTGLLYCCLQPSKKTTDFQPQHPSFTRVFNSCASIAATTARCHGTKRQGWPRGVHWKHSLRWVRSFTAQSHC